jgi:hypothetical protein
MDRRLLAFVSLFVASGSAYGGEGAAPAAAPAASTGEGGAAPAVGFDVNAAVVGATSGASDAEAGAPDVLRGERYDGRAARRPARDLWLALPRLLLAPPRLVVRGLGAAARPLVEWSERNHVPETLASAITSADGRIGVRPTVDYQNEFKPSFGLSFFDQRLWRDLRLTVSAAFGGPGVLADEARLRLPWWRKRALVEVAAAYRRRDDELFTGIGMTGPRAFARYAVDQADAGARLTLLPIQRVRLELGLGAGLRRFGDGDVYENIRPISAVYCVRGLGGRCASPRVDEAQVPGFTRGTQFVRARFGLRVDSRADETRSGIIAGGSAEYTHGLGADPSRYLRLGAHVGTQLELWRHRALYVGVAAEDELAFDHTAVPFSELVQLGGVEDLRGFMRGRFRDASSWLATVEYRWPVWMWMDGALFCDYGGVFGPAFKGFSVGALRPDVGFGVRVRVGDRFLLRVQVAYGFGDGGGWRLVVAGNGNPS